MIKLKTLLQSRYIILLFIVSIAYSLVITKIFKYDTVYTNDTNITGVIKEYNIDGDKLSYVIKTKENELLRGTYYIKNHEEFNMLNQKIGYGMTLYVNGSLSIPNSNTIPNTFNYKKYLYNKKIYRTINTETLQIIKEESIINKIRNKLIRYLKKQNNNDYLLAFIIGDKTEISEDTYNNYRKNGVTHLFAISGMHISLFAFILRALLKNIKIKEYKKDIIIISFLFFYGYITGYPPSIKRAIIIYTLCIINERKKLKIPHINLLYITIIILIITNPFVIYDIGFIYSAITCYALIITSKITKNKSIIITAFLTSLIAFLFSAPITLYYFYEANILSIINNMIFIPWITIIVYPLTLIVAIIPLIHPLYAIVINITELLNNISSNVFYLNITIKFNQISIIIYYILLLISIRYSKKYIITFFIYVVLIKFTPFIDNNTYIYYLDVGQGDSTLLVDKYKSNVTLIDTGGKMKYKTERWKERKNNFNITDNTITFVKSLGLSKIDNLILTHGDYDHMGEAINLVNNFKVEKVIFNCGEFNELEQDLIKVLDKKKIPYYSCIKELNIDDNKLYFLNNKNYDNENDNSSVIYTEFNNYKFLFMGDAGIEVEEDLIEKYNLQDIDVLKVGHHGSKTSSSKNFINEIEPKYSIISVGKNNHYGHPNNGVLNNLEDSKIYRTDQDGSIMFKIKNNELQIETCAP